MGPVVLFIIDTKLEIGLYYTVLPLGLAISLGVENNGESLFNLKEVV